MNNNFRWGGIALLLVGAMGCGTSETPQGKGRHGVRAPSVISVDMAGCFG